MESIAEPSLCITLWMRSLSSPCSIRTKSALLVTAPLPSKLIKYKIMRAYLAHSVKCLSRRQPEHPHHVSDVSESRVGGGCKRRGNTQEIHFALS